ncbi:MAG: hypothetical protein WB760_12215 [Xanthobacteraceae bacterium]
MTFAVPQSFQGWVSISRIGNLPLVAAAVLCAVVVLLVRAPDAFTNPQMWAEDATVFWIQQYQYGWAAVVMPYAGYLHLAVRLTAGLASLFDPAYAPTIYVGASAFFAAWSAATAATVTVKPIVKFLFAATLTLPPHPTGEIFGNLANVQWLMAPTLVLVLATDPPASRFWRLNQSAFVLVSGLSGPFSIFLLPLSVWRIVRNIDGPSVLATVSGTLQLATLAMSLSQMFPQPGESAPLHLIVMMLGRCVHMSPWAAAAGLAVLFASLTISEGRWVRLCLLYLASAIIISAALKFRQDSYAFDSPEDGPRYFYIPQLVIVWCAISLCFSRRAGIIVGIAALVTLALTYPHEFFKRPQLPDELWAEHVKNIGKMLVVIPVNPPGWSVTVPEPESIWSTH